MSVKIREKEIRDEWAYLRLTIKVPKSWVPRIKRKAIEQGYPSIAQLVRELLREAIGGD